jgi:hypothetical protein
MGDDGLLRAGVAPDQMRQMALILDSVWEELPEPDRSDARRQQLALFIVDRYARGEHDPARLTELVRSAFVGSASNAAHAGP